MTDYQVDPEALKQTAAGINDAIDQLKAVGMAQSADLGRGFDELELTGLQIGSQDVKGAFDEFCERWQWMVRGLIQQGNEIADKLHLSAGIYHDQEQYVSGTLKDVVNAAMGDPNLSQDQVEKKSWSQIGADNPFEQFAHADYSAKSFDAAMKHSGATWANEGADVADNWQVQAMAAMTGTGDDLAAGKAQAQAAAKKLNQEATNEGWKS